MPPVCTLCRHPDRAEIDAALVAPSEPLRIIAGRFGTSSATLLRHREHLPRALVVALEAAESTRADTLLEKVHRIEADARRLLEKAEATGDLRCAIAAAKTSLDVVEMLLKVREAERLTRIEPPTPILSDGDVVAAIESLLGRAGNRAEVVQ